MVSRSGQARMEYPCSKDKGGRRDRRGVRAPEGSPRGLEAGRGVTMWGLLP